MFIVNTGDVLDEVDRLVDQDIQSSRARIDWLRCIAIVGPFLGLLCTINNLSIIFRPIIYPTCTRGFTVVGMFTDFPASFLCTAAGLAIAIVFLPAHHILRNKATVLLLKTRDEIKAMFLRTRPFRDIGKTIARAGGPGGRERIRQYITKGLKVRHLNLSSAVAVLLACAVPYFVFSDHWKFDTPPLSIRLPSAQPAEMVDVLTPIPQGRILTLHHPQGDARQCMKPDGRTVCQNETHWKIHCDGQYWGFEFADSGILHECLRILGSTRKDSYIFLRADAAAPFGLVRRVVEACRQAGIEKVEFGVASPPQSAAARP